METIVAIDGSTSKTGVAVFGVLKSGKVKYKSHDLFISPDFKYTSKKKGMSKTAYKTLHSKEKRLDQEIRVDYMIRHLENYLNKHKPNIIVMEDTYAEKDIMALKMLSRIQGAVLSWCQRNNASITFKIPGTWRKEVGMPLIDNDGNRYKREDFKEFSVNLVRDELGMIVTDDEADAICMGFSMEENRKVG